MDTPRRRRTDWVWYKFLVYGAPKHIFWGLGIAAALWAWAGFKGIEPLIFPVVSEFTIDKVEEADGKQSISGMMVKNRNCHFLEVVAYSEDRLVALQFTETPAPVSRVKGKQAWGVWLLLPPVKQLTLYSRHDCETGEVTTKLWEGEL